MTNGTSPTLFNRYLDEADETDGLALVPFFMAIKATVRAHVTAVQAGEAVPNRAAPLQEEAQAYFELACRLLKSVRPTLIAIGGLSGSGKSTAAASYGFRVRESGWIPGGRRGG